MFRRIAIIGGGAAGATLLNELLERPTTQPLHLDWYTGAGTPSRGMAYGTRSERHLLNVRAASMGMSSTRPGSFLQYMQERDPNVSGSDFLPRCHYGEYLEAETAAALTKARARGQDVRVIPYEADAVVPENDGVTIFQGEETTRVDAAVLALGALPPRPLADVDEAALESGRYIYEPWSFLADVQPDAQPRKVLVIGLGLTAVDVLLELADKWPNAQFTAISRHGVLPEAHLAHAVAAAEDSEDMVESMRDAPDIRTWAHLLREAIAQHDDWRSVVDSLRPHTAALWGVLPHTERARFLRHLRWAWERARHRLPPVVAKAIYALEKNGRLQRHCGHMRHVQVHGDGLRMELEPRGAEIIRTIDADLIIQTTGLETDVRRSKHRLIQQMTTNGHIQPDAFGLGIHAAPDGRLCHQDKPWSRLFALGSLLRGTLWESTAMPEIRQQARLLANQLLSD